MCRTFPSPLTVPAAVGGYPNAPPESPAMPRAVPTPAPGRTYVPWGMLAAIDLHGCDSGRLADPDAIRAFVPAVIDAIGMRAHGPLVLERFGDGELEGWSAMQFIETSSITIHADEVRAAASSTVLLPAVRPDEAAAVAVGTSAAGRSCGCSSDDRYQAAIKTNRPPLPRRRRALTAWMITLAAMAAST